MNNDIKQLIRFEKFRIIITTLILFVIMLIPVTNAESASEVVDPVNKDELVEIEDVEGPTETPTEAPTENIDPDDHLDIFIKPEPIRRPSVDTDTTEPTEYSSEALSKPQTNEQPSVDILDDAELLAIVIYQEAGADYCCDDCRRRVADVVLNRVESEWYPDTIYEVLMQEYQYGRFHWTGVVWASSASDPNNAHAVERARRIAREVLNGQHSEIYGDSYYGQAVFVNGTSGFWCCGIYFARFAGM